MTHIIKSKTTVRGKVAGAMAALALSGALVAGGTIVPGASAWAEAVRVDAPKAVNFADVVEAVSPAVVSVRVEGKRPERRTSRRGGSGSFGFDQLPKDHPLRKFFDGFGGEQFGFNRERERRFDRRNKRQERRSQRVRPMSQGSGFFVSDDGYVVTNNHVVKGGSGYKVVLEDGTEFDAKLIGTDPKTDLAVLKVDEDQKFTYVKFSETRSRVGEWVVAVGNPFGLGGTVTAGIVSADGRDIGSGPYDDFIQIDAAVNKGNSGGPAFNLNGEVIGVNTAIFSPSGGNVGIAFAISANTATEIVDDLIKNGKVTRGWLGVQIQPVTKDIAESLGMSNTDGAIVAEASPDSPASKSGIRAGDVILKVEDTRIESPKSLARLIADYEPDQTVAVAVLRDGEEVSIDVKLGTLPGSQRAALTDDTDENDDSSDTASVELDEFGIAIIADGEGVTIADVDPDGAAAEKGLKAGDRIVSINGRPTGTVNEVGQAVARAMEDERKAVLFQIESGKRNRFVALPVSQG